MSDRKQPKIPSRKKRTNTVNARPRLSRPLTLLSIPETSAAEQSLSEEKDEDELKEGLSVLSTHLMPVAPHHHETVLREMASEHPTVALPVPPSGARSNSNKLERLWRFSPVLLIAIAIILVPFIGGGVLEAAQLNQVRNSLYQVDAVTGNTLWQQTITAPMQVTAVDMQGSLLNITAGQHMRQLVALDTNGVIRWKTFASQESFSLPNVPSQTGTVVVALGNIAAAGSAQFIPPNALAGDNAVDAVPYHPLSLYLFKRVTGQTIWQKSIVGDQQEQDGTVLGGDAQFIYVALTPTQSAVNKVKPVIQLLAINQQTGIIAWRVTTHNLDALDAINRVPTDAGRVLAQQDHIIWQVAGTIYDIDATTGKIRWNQFLQERATQTLLQEEAQMVEVAGVVLVGRSGAYQALDQASGDERWVLTNPGVGSSLTQPPWGVVVSNNTVLLYGNGQIQAIDATNQQVIWSLKELDSVENLTVSDDGTLVYATVTDSIEGSPPAQSLVALDMKNGAARWTYQPFEQTTYIPVGINGIIYRHNILLTVVCPSSANKACSSRSNQQLFALNALTGAELWKYQGNSISDVHLSADGSTVVFQSNSSAWLDLTARFRG